MRNPLVGRDLARIWRIAAVSGLLATLAMELAFSIRLQSQTWDEADHMLAGYRYWQAQDFGINSEHPPLVKLLATIPLLALHPEIPAVPKGASKVETFRAGRKFLYSNDADTLLFLCRASAGVLSLLLALLIFVTARRFFGTGQAILALALFVFEPNLLAHGALVTTDMGVTCFLFVAVYAFYLYIQEPSALKLAECGLATGVTLAAKHSGVLVLPILALLGLVEVWLRSRQHSESRGDPVHEGASRGRYTARLGGSLLTISLLSVATLWAAYGFRFRARPGNLKMTPPLLEYVRGGAQPGTGVKNPLYSRAILGLAKGRLLPEAYLYGLADVLTVSAGPKPAYLFGRLYPTGQWFYFPAVFIIKSTLGFLILLSLALASSVLWKPETRREFWFLALPPAFYLSVSMTSHLNEGVRHILPAYPFLLILAAAGAWQLARRNRTWHVAVGVLVAFHIFSSLRAYPFYMAYSNELWGGTAKTWRVLSDSNTDWGQELKTVKEYLVQNRVSDCWLAYFGSADPAYYGIPCKILPDQFSLYWGRTIDVAPSKFEGTLLISASELASIYFGPGELSPYSEFENLAPAKNLGGAMLIYKGSLDLSSASRWSRIQRAWQLETEGKTELALAEARAVTAQAPRMVYAHYTLGSFLARAGQKDEARREYQAALALARSVYPQYQWYWPPFLEAQLRSL